MLLKPFHIYFESLLFNFMNYYLDLIVDGGIKGRRWVDESWEKISRCGELKIEHLPLRWWWMGEERLEIYHLLDLLVLFGRMGRDKVGGWGGKMVDGRDGGTSWSFSFSSSSSSISCLDDFFLFLDDELLVDFEMSCL